MMAYKKRELGNRELSQVKVNRDPALGKIKNVPLSIGHVDSVPTGEPYT
jgi:hypothetical protein